MKEKNARAEKEKQDAKDLVQDLNLRSIVTTSREVKGSGISTKISPKEKVSSPEITSTITGNFPIVLGVFLFLRNSGKTLAD
jgi:uncharacterized protein YlxW (UPF0749 family)